MFPESKAGITDYHTLPTKGAFDSELETFVREVLQNANDQGPKDEDEPVKVRFRFEELRGEEEVEEFLQTLHWDPDDDVGLLDHLLWATQNDQLRVPGLKRFLDGFDRDRLLLLVVEDWNTTGLEGAETDGSRPFGALVQDWGSTDKPSSSSGGTHGLGKSVLWAFSGLSTVLFCSTPTEMPEPGLSSPRLIGRCIVPAHDHDGDGTPRYTNHGWYGQVTELDDIHRYPSVWGSDPDNPAGEVAHSLRIDRNRSVPGIKDEGGDIPGTSIGIVGFRLPGENLTPDPEELAPRFKAASAKYFWPAIADEDLEVYVETPGGEPEQVTFDDAPGVEPFVRCYADRFSIDDSVAELTGSGSSVKTSVDLTVPRENPDVVDDPHGEIDTECDLVIRRPTPGELDQLEANDDEDLSPNRVARLRGAQMIVDYVSMDNVATDERDFVATLVCGTAKVPPGESPDDEHEAAETFLQRSEPTQHDDWVGSKNEYLKDFYAGTIVREIEGLGGTRLEAALADFVGVDVETGDEVPGLGDLLPIMSGFPGRDDHEDPLLNWDRRPDPSLDEETGRWTFEGIVGPNREDFDEWSVAIELIERDEENKRTGQLKIEVKSDTDGAEVPDSLGTELVIECGADVPRIHFEGRSERVGGTNINLGNITQMETRIKGTLISGGEE
ncbi:hypothetical protein ACFQKF_08485 [Halalkalicoccus sp. GCM10025322]|uniref:hypothetical protein n=1 Tax=Halalkalicoccus TaxID=332246 RepID=UPI002F96BE78